eukprot:TRINITY_DN28693_c0_g2_i2.p1 TRINITY_DN28693_c0_g2~~TRINITY_DN28693_c0_g2_i2.p1  ORF type:complete len:339 (-),score=29.19 TRINITY_DN28693_c0_g2_i2:610-1626(-)
MQKPGCCWFVTVPVMGYSSFSLLYGLPHYVGRTPEVPPSLDHEVVQQSATRKNLEAIREKLPFLKAVDGVDDLTTPVWVGQGRFWQRAFYQASNPNATSCDPGTAFSRQMLKQYGYAVPMYNGIGLSAGPVLPTADLRGGHGMDAHDMFVKLDNIQALLHGEAIQFVLPGNETGEETLIFDRLRFSSSSGVAFLNDGRHLVVVPFMLKRMFLYEFKLDTGSSENSYARLLHSIALKGFVDLVKYGAERQLLAVSLLKLGAQQFVKVDFQARRLVAYKTTYIFSAQRQYCHGISFFPSSATIVVAATSSGTHSRTFAAGFVSAQVFSGRHCAWETRDSC